MTDRTTIEIDWDNKLVGISRQQIDATAKADKAVEITTATEAAILVQNLKGIDVWIPKSQISDYVGDDIDEAETIFIPEWLANKNELI